MATGATLQSDEPLSPFPPPSPPSPPPPTHPPHWPPSPPSPPRQPSLAAELVDLRRWEEYTAQEWVWLLMLAVLILVTLSGLFSNLGAMLSQAHEAGRRQARLETLTKAAAAYEKRAADASGGCEGDDGDDDGSLSSGWDAVATDEATAVSSGGGDKGGGEEEEDEEENGEEQGVTILLPCYLPNEQHILNGTLRHLRARLRCAGAVELIVCYNTPTPLAIEAELHRLDGRMPPHMPPWELPPSPHSSTTLADQPGSILPPLLSPHASA